MSRIAAVLLVLAWLAAPCLKGASADGTPILDTRSYWRVHVTLRPEVFGSSSSAKPDSAGIPVERRTNPVTGELGLVPIMPASQPSLPFPPEDWMQPDFDDGGWWRDPGPFYGTPEVTRKTYRPMGISCHDDRYGGFQPRSLALLCVRGKFTVDEPSKVTGLKLRVVFRGGLIAYLNGKEVHRAHMAAGGGAGPEALAEDYPLDAYTDKGAELRVRQVSGVSIPLSGLRKGTNVLALAIHRAAIPADKVRQRREDMWSTVGLLEVQFGAEGQGVVPNVARPPGLQVWNANPLESVFDTDYGDPHEKLLPVHIVGTPGGTFSGQVVVGSDAPIVGISARIGALKMGDKALPASGVEIFYPRPTSREHGGKVVSAESLRFDALEEVPPDEVPVKKPAKPAPGLGAVQPVWLRVAIPRDAQPGRYRGALAVRVGDRTVSEIPVCVEVVRFRLPEPGDFRTWVDFIQSPETLALRYKVPLWSDRHFELIARTFRLLAGVGNKTLYVPLICKTNLGNGESMVRWVSRPDGGHDHDFSVFEKYVDCALKQGIRPQVVCFQVWDYHIGTSGAQRGFGSDFDFRIGGMGGKNVDAGVPVSLLERASGSVKDMTGPTYSDPKADAFWKPVAEGIRKRMAERGLGKAMMLGIVSDSVPGKHVVELWQRLLPETPWVCMAHAGADNIYGVPIGYRTMVHLFKAAPDPEVERLRGWDRAQVVTLFPRIGTMGSAESAFMPLTFFRLLFEWNIQGRQRGVGRLAADFFPTQAGWGGARISNRYPETSWGNLNLGASWLAPGKDGAISTIAFEMGREGIQECEAYIAIDRALTDEKLRARLDAALAKKARAVLDERVRYNLWAMDMRHWAPRDVERFLPGGSIGFDWYAGGSRWQERSRALYEAAAEVVAVP